MSYCKVCGKKLELTPEYDMCMECQGKQHQAFTLPSNNNTVSNKTEMITHEDIIIKAKASISWIYSNILGKTVEAQLRTANEIVQAREEYISWVSYLLPIEQALTELEELKRYPTSEEVCKALSDYFGFNFYYQDKFFYKSDGIKYIYPIKVSGFIEIQMYDGHLPPHLITLIGPFYEAQE